MLKASIFAIALAPAILAATANASFIDSATLRFGAVEGTIDAFGASLDTDQGQTFGAAIGHDLGGPFSVELSVDNGTADLGAFLPIEANLLTYSASLQMEVNQDGQLRPFVGVGYDYSQASGNADIEGSGTGWHYDLGVRTPIAGGFSLEVMRRAHEGDVDLDFVGDVSVETVAWTLGLSKSF